MHKNRLTSWCHAATILIRFGPDRKAVYNELLAHLEERRDAFMEQGLNEREASTKALEAMGDAYEIAPQLAAIHRPFWGYFLRVSRIFLVILLVLSLKPIWDYAKNLHFYDKPNAHTFDVYDAASYGGDTGRTLLHLSQPDVSFSSDGSTFTLTDAVVYTEYSEYFERDRTYLCVLIRQETKLPWTEHDGYFGYFSATGWFCARDDLGNVYPGKMEYHPSDAFALQSYGVQSGLFAYTHQCTINDFPVEAQWVEIYYERDGRSYALRVNLTGGGTK